MARSAELDFPTTPSGALGELWAACLNLVTQIGRRPVCATAVINATETAVAHGLGFAPKACFTVGHANVAIWRSKAPDSKYVYLIAASQVTADVVVIP